MGRPNVSPRRILDRAFDDGAIGGNEKLVFLVMCRRGNATGSSFMSIETLVKECGVSRSTVTRSLASLRKKMRIIAAGRRPHTSTNRYQLNPSAQIDPLSASKRPISSGQDDLQNLNANQKENPAQPPQCWQSSPRSCSTVPIGSASSRIIKKLSE